VIVDVGANYGVFTHLAHTLNANAQVLSVEPQPDLWHRICEYNREHGFVGSFAVQTACGDHHHEATLLMRYPGDMSATLVPEHAERGSLQVLLVPVVPLDQLVADLGTIDVLKIDAEGHDYQVLCGLSDIAKRVRFVIVEKRPLTPGAWCSVTSLLGPRFVQIPLTANDCLYVNKDLVPSEPVKCAMKTI
jgi:FkbM family methyltransferase